MWNLSLSASDNSMRWETGQMQNMRVREEVLETRGNEKKDITFLGGSGRVNELGKDNTIAKVNLCT